MANKTTIPAQTKLGKLKATLLDAYYGHPMKDMKLICIAGTTGKVEVANFVHKILEAAGHPVSVLATDEPIKTTAFYKFLSTAWKGGSNYVVVTAPADSIKKDVFYGLPIHVAALTNFTPAESGDQSSSEYSSGESILFQMNPDFVILNHDDSHYADFSDFAGSKGTITYGADRFSNVRIMHSKLYKMGAEATLTIGGNNFTVATFLNGEPAVSYMAAAAAIADTLHVIPDKIAEGIANYDPAD